MLNSANTPDPEAPVQMGQSPRTVVTGDGGSGVAASERGISSRPWNSDSDEAQWYKADDTQADDDEAEEDEADEDELEEDEDGEDQDGDDDDDDDDEEDEDGDDDESGPRMAAAVTALI